MMIPQLKTGNWFLKELESVPKNNKKVFSCFHCGGGSTMGYKLAGYEMLGGVDIDKDMMKLYRANHNPKHSYLMGVQEFNKIPNNELPKELFELDILDGSPPCSSFSMAGKREKLWSVKKKFREGQAEQVLDDLFFHFIDTANKLRPKIVVAENVKGLIQGNAKGYVKQIAQMFNMIGYDVQLFLFNAAFMGVPQKRERTFFIARRRDLELKPFKIMFSEIPVTLIDVYDGCSKVGSQKYSNARFGDKIVNMNEPLNTITTLGRMFINNTDQLNGKTILRCQSFPDDYNFIDQETKYVCGMSVPPFMMQRVAREIGIQLGWYNV